MYTCKNCKCFKRAKEGEWKNLAASAQLQMMADSISSDDEDSEDDFVQQDFEFTNMSYMDEY